MRANRLFAYVITVLLVFSAGVQAQKMRVHFIDVGQGAATLLEFSCGAILVDTGSEMNKSFDGNDAVMSYLEEFFTTRPDLNKTLKSLVLTHAHIDHTRSVKNILEKYQVQNGVTNGLRNGSGRAGQNTLHSRNVVSEQGGKQFGFTAVWMRDVAPGVGLTSRAIDPIQCDDVDPVLTALWGRVHSEFGWTAKQIGNGNNHSVVLRVDFGKASLLITGDLEEDAIPDFLKLHASTKILDVDVYQVGHHGAANGTTEALLKALTPQIAVIAMGPADREEAMTAWKHGHPRKQTVDFLSRHVTGKRTPTSGLVATGQSKFVSAPISRAIYTTGWDGDIVFEADVNGSWKRIDENDLPAKIDLNVALEPELMGLPMIGAGRARAIVEYRKPFLGRGERAFVTLEDLMNVQGIGEGTLTAVRHLITVNN